MYTALDNYCTPTVIMVPLSRLSGDVQCRYSALDKTTALITVKTVLFDYENYNKIYIA